MVMAARTTERHRQERLARRIELLVDGIHQELIAVRFSQHLRAIAAIARPSRPDITGQATFNRTTATDTVGQNLPAHADIRLRTQHRQRATDRVVAMRGDRSGSHTVGAI